MCHSPRFYFLLLLLCAVPALMSPGQETARYPIDGEPVVPATGSEPMHRLPPVGSVADSILDIEIPPPVETEVEIDPNEDPMQLGCELDSDQPEPDEESPWQYWSGSFELGLNGTEGNTQNFSVRIGANLTHEKGPVTHTFELTQLRKNSEGKKTANTLLLDERVEWELRRTPWTYYIHLGSEYDEFKSFGTRVSGDTGLGRRWVDDETTKLTTRCGASCSKETKGADRDVVPELSFDAELSHKLNERQKMALEVEYYPDVTDWVRYRLNTQASWEIMVDPDWNLSLKLGAINRYDSTAEDDKSHNDIDYSALMLMSF